MDFLKSLGKMAGIPEKGSSQEALFGSAEYLEPVKPAWYLEITQGRQEWSIIPIAYKKMLVCRYLRGAAYPSSSIVLADSTISSPQALFYYDEGQNILTLIHHKRALNPTMINGRAIEEHRIKENDQISAGFVRMNAKWGSREALHLGLDQETAEKVREAAYSIKVLEGPDAGVEFSLGEPFHVIGRGLAVRRSERSSACEESEFIALIDPAISREQSFLRWKEGGFEIRKSPRANVPVVLGKKRGDEVFWQNIEPGISAALEKDDLIRIGNTLCSVNSRVKKRSPPPPEPPRKARAMYPMETGEETTVVADNHKTRSLDDYVFPEAPGDSDEMLQQSVSCSREQVDAKPLITDFTMEVPGGGKEMMGESFSSPLDRIEAMMLMGNCAMEKLGGNEKMMRESISGPQDTSEAQAPVEDCTMEVQGGNEKMMLESIFGPQDKGEAVTLMGDSKWVLRVVEREARTLLKNTAQQNDGESESSEEDER